MCRVTSKLVPAFPKGKLALTDVKTKKLTPVFLAKDEVKVTEVKTMLMAPPKRKSVSFKPTVVMYKTLHINDLSDDEVKSTWYNDEEIAQIRLDCRKTIDLMLMQEKPVDTDRLCSRGLEQRTPEGSQRRLSKRFASIDAVLDEQDRAWALYNAGDESTMNNFEESIASMYRRHTIVCQEDAHMQGLDDQQINKLCSVHNSARKSTCTRKSPMRSRWALGTTSPPKHERMCT